MSGFSTAKLLRAAKTVNRVNQARKNPARFVRNRAKSKALGAVGFWRLMARFWRA